MQLFEAKGHPYQKGSDKSCAQTPGGPWGLGTRLGSEGLLLAVHSERFQQCLLNPFLTIPGWLNVVIATVITATTTATTSTTTVAATNSDT